MLENALYTHKKEQHYEQVMRIWVVKQGEATVIVEKSRQPH